MTTDSTLNGTYRSMQAEAQAMRAAGEGSIVNISSVAGYAAAAGSRRTGRPRRALTCSRVWLLDEWGEYSIRVNWRCRPDHHRHRFAPHRVIPPRRGVHPADPARPIRRARICRAVTFLLSDGAAFITGQCLCVDGGLALRGLPEPEHGELLRRLIPDFF